MLHDVELLCSYKNVIAFLRLKSYVAFWGEKKLWKGSHTLSNTTIFSRNGLYKTCFYLLIYGK